MKGEDKTRVGDGRMREKEKEKSEEKKTGTWGRVSRGWRERRIDKS